MDFSGVIVTYVWAPQVASEHARVGVGHRCRSLNAG